MDASWPEFGLAVELDGRTYHETRAAFERDRERDRALQVAGFDIVRFTPRDLARADIVARTVTSLLELRGWGGCG